MYYDIHAFEFIHSLMCRSSKTALSNKNSTKRLKNVISSFLYIQFLFAD